MSESSVCTLQADNTLQQNALLAVPKKGRLYDACIKLLLGAGLDHIRPNRLDVAHCTSLPITLVFLPAADIATYVGEGDVDAGITGLDVVSESEVDVEQILVRVFTVPIFKAPLCTLLSLPVSCAVCRLFATSSQSFHPPSPTYSN
ncbi:hypothetical protein B484DRAFT_205856 [Ochromonadaceae sp. CCMP2298]|nr:hypothetical protein B484DRAFT_205856 [Ochromonadaceae sp. CCMP2298]